MVEYLYTMRTLSKDLYPFKSGAEAADSAYTNKGFQYLLEAMSSAIMAQAIGHRAEARQGKATK